jgi:hypothetical protein
MVSWTMQALPMAALPMAGRPMAGRPMAGWSAAALPTAGRPMAGWSMAGVPMAHRPMAALPMADLPMAGWPMAGRPMAGWPMAGRPMAGLPMAVLPMAGPVPGDGPTLSMVARRPAAAGHSVAAGLSVAAARRRPGQAAREASGWAAPQLDWHSVFERASRSSPPSVARPGSFLEHDSRVGTSREGCRTLCKHDTALWEE